MTCGRSSRIRALNTNWSHQRASGYDIQVQFFISNTPLFPPMLSKHTFPHWCRLVMGKEESNVMQISKEIKITSIRLCTRVTRTHPSAPCWYMLNNSVTNCQELDENIDVVTGITMLVDASSFIKSSRCTSFEDGAPVDSIAALQMRCRDLTTRLKTRIISWERNINDWRNSHNLYIWWNLRHHDTSICN